MSHVPSAVLLTLMQMRTGLYTVTFFICHGRTITTLKIIFDMSIDLKEAKVPQFDPYHREFRVVRIGKQGH